MPGSTRFLQDILRQPNELQSALAFLRGPGATALREAASLVRRAQHVFLTGIGASWNACFGSATILSVAGHPVFTPEASELLHFAELPRGSVLVVLSRTGRSIEIVQLLEKARASGAHVIGITNSPEGALAEGATIPVVVPVPLDHAISVNTYSSLALAAGALASATVADFAAVASPLSHAITQAEAALPQWQQDLEASDWPSPGATYYFLARGASRASCHQARLLWEEGAKSAATAMSTSGFRHGPQEIVHPGARFAIWLDSRKMRQQDLATVADLETLAASVALIGNDLPPNAGSLKFEIPKLPEHWEFLLNIFPAQLAAERLARMSGVDCDSFRVCSFVVEDEQGLLRKKAEAPTDGK